MRRHFIYAGTSVASLAAGQWRLESDRLGFREIDAAIESVPTALRMPGTAVWIVWNNEDWRLEALFPRNTEDGADIPDPWHEMFLAQERVLASRP